MGGYQSWFLYRIDKSYQAVNQFDVCKVWTGTIPANPIQLSNSLLTLVVDDNDVVWASQISRIVRFEASGPGNAYEMKLMDWEGILPTAYHPKIREDYLSFYPLDNLLDNHTFAICRSQSGGL